MTPPEPRTAAGQAYLQSWQAQVRWIRNRQKHGTFAEETYLHEARDAILAIEAEASSDSEALRAALERLVELDDEWGEKPEPESAWALAKEQARAALTPVAKDD
jgi:hypothetical protein